jgi:hypothetical protein
VILATDDFDETVNLVKLCIKDKKVIVLSVQRPGPGRQSEGNFLCVIRPAVLTRPIARTVEPMISPHARHSSQARVRAFMGGGNLDQIFPGEALSRGTSRG